MMLLQVVTLVLAAKTVTLDEVKTASRHNLDAIRAEVELTKANANKTIAISGMLPRGVMQAGASYQLVGPATSILQVQTVNDAGVREFSLSQNSIGGYNRLSLSLGVTVSQLIFDARFWAQLAQAGALQEATTGELAEQRLASEVEAVRRFYNVVFAQQARSILEGAVERSKAQLSRALALYAAGKGHQHDVLDARVNLGNDNITLLRWEQFIVSTQADLAQWLTWKYEPLTAVAPAILQLKTPMVAPAMEKVLELAKANRPIIKAMASRVKAAEAAISVARSEYFPAVSVSGQYAREAPSGSLFVNPTSQNVVAVGATLSWNFFSGLGTMGRDRSAQADLVVQEATRTQALVNIEADIAREYEVLKTALEIAAMAEKNKEFAEEETRLEEQRYTVGLGSNIDVRNAQVKLIQSQQAALSARFDVEVSRAKLSRLAGVSIEEKPTSAR